MSIKVAYKDGVFEPLEELASATPGAIYTVFSDEELQEIRETLDRRLSSRPTPSTP